MKSIALATIVATLASSMALGQTNAESEITQTFANLRGLDKVYFRLNGNEYFGKSTTPIAVDVFWSRPLASTAQDMKLEIVESRANLQSRRILADGKYVWGVDPIKNTYQSSIYGSYATITPTNYVQNGLQAINLMASGQSAWLSRLCLEVWAGDDSLFRPWIPASSNRSERTVEGVGDSFPDPLVSSRIYVSSDSTKYYVYWLTRSGVVTKSLTFQTEYNQDTNQWDLKKIYQTETTRIGSVDRTVDWTIDVYTGVLPSNGNFVFVPPANARPIASPRATGG